MTKRALLLLTALSIVLCLHAQEDNCHLSIGTNLAGPTDYGSEWPFVNIMKNARTWETTNAVWTGGRDLWNSDLLEYFDFDDEGYPLEVPLSINHPNADTIQVIRTVWANTDALPEGEYVLLYDGTGRININFDGQIVREEPGRIVLDMQHNGNIMGLYIMESQRGDHIRNMRLYLPGTEDQDGGDIWSEEWLDKLQPFTALRFMDWGHTNNSPLRQWSDRPMTTDYTYTPNGVPYEYWAEICNLKNADAWVCVPHLADEDYIRQMARFFRDQMDPELKIYVEYSNEVWNWIFAQAHYCNDSLDQTLEWPERIGPKVAEVMEIWTEEFAGQTDRLVRVMATQHGWFDIGDRIYRQIETEGKDHLIDAISPASYMSVDHNELAGLGASAEAIDVIEGARRVTFDPTNWSLSSWIQHAQLASSKDKQLIFYEGGQHFTPDPWGTVQLYNLALLEAQVHPEMYELYNELIDTLAGLSDQDMLMMHFSFIAPLGDEPEDARWGSFGSLTSQFFQFEPYDDAPKYRALRDHINNCRISTDVEDLQSVTCQNIVIFQDQARVEVDQTSTLQIFEGSGKVLSSMKLERGLHSLPLTFELPGLYLFSLSSDQGRCIQKVVR